MITPTGYWEVDVERISGEPFDKGLFVELVDFIKEQRISYLYDFGCGAGKYVKAFNEVGIWASGYDGNPITDQFDYCHVLDLSKDIKLPEVDLILSLEVGEHIPAEFEKVFINNLVKSLDKGGYLVLSWAVPGQGGYGHVNEKTNDEVIELVGLRYDKELTDRIRAATTVQWFKNTLMVFEK